MVRQPIRRLALEQSQPGFDVHIGRIQVSSSGVCVKRITGLIVARLVLVECQLDRSIVVVIRDNKTYKSAKIIPNLRDVRVQADGTRVCIESVPILVNLVIENTDRAPEGWIATVTVDGLLVCFVRLRVLLL